MKKYSLDQIKPELLLETNCECKYLFICFLRIGIQVVNKQSCPLERGGWWWAKKKNDTSYFGHITVIHGVLEKKIICSENIHVKQEEDNNKKTIDSLNQNCTVNV